MFSQQLLQNVTNHGYGEVPVSLLIFLLITLSDQPLAKTSEQQADEQNMPDSIDPSSFTDTSATPQVYDSPPTAADQEAPPSASITNEMSKETGATMNVNDYL